MIDKPIDTISPEDIQSLIDNSVGESRHLEYKQALPGNGDEDKREFLADVSSFANAAGGCIVYGVVEKRDADGKTTGEPEAVTGVEVANTDIERLRFEDAIRTNVDPRIPGIQMRWIENFALGPVLVLQIPRSWLSPHMVTFKNLSRFYSRHSGGKYQLDVTELRSTFLLSEGRTERVKRFRDERLARVISGDTPALLPNSPKVVLHVVPVGAFGSTFPSEIPLIAVRDELDFRPLVIGSYNTRYNLDGLLKYSGTRETSISQSYLQIFRHGAIEAVYALHSGGAHGPQIIEGRGLESEILQGLDRYLRAMNKISIEPPLVVMLSFIGISGYSIEDRSAFGHGYTFDRDLLILPDVLVEDYANEIDIILHPVLDALWQAGGWSRCSSYNNEGRHKSIKP